jgi:hypothetical protein
MADSSKGLPSGLGSSLILILLLTGVAIWQWPLESLRPPASRATPVDRIAALQDIPARLWQDPFVATRGAAKAPAKPGAVRRPVGVDEIVSEYLKVQRSSAGLQIEILAVMVSGGRSADDAEGRLRTRYAVVSGILESDYAPDDPENLGLAVIPVPQPASPSQKIFSVPFEWYSCSPVGAAPAAASCGKPEKRLLVLWINDTVLDQTSRPLLNLLKLFSGVRRAAPERRVTVLGPTSSDTLSKYVQEAAQGSDALRAETRESLRIISPSATVADHDLLQGAGMPPDGRQSLSSFFFDTIKLRFARTVGPDEQLLKSIVGELGLRGLSPPLCLAADWSCDAPNTILLIYEADSLYARTLVAKFAQALRERCSGLADPQRKRCLYLQESRLRSFEYLRGLDGDSGGAGDADASAKRDDGGDAKAKPAAKERPYGPSQYDYLRRMSRSIVDIQASLLSQRGWMKPRIRAVGVFGSDTFDKLLILQAVKPLLPEASFFTVDLDARFLEPDQYAWTRNLLIASNFGLELDPRLQQRSPPFRDTYQSGAFLATRLALACPQAAMPAELLARTRLYEVGRGEAVDLSAFEDASPKKLDTDCPLFASDPKPGLHRERSDLEDFSVGGWGFFKAGVVCLLGFLLFSTFFTTTRATAPLSDFAWFGGALVAAVAAYELFYRVIIADAREEPWRLFSGVSAWPTEFVLVATIGYCVWSVQRIRANIAASNRELGKEFFSASANEELEKTHPGRSRRQQIVALGEKLMRPAWEGGADGGYARLWLQYLKHGDLFWSMLRAAGASMLFLAAWIALTLNHPPIVPLRGTLSYGLDFVVSKTALFSLMWLAFFVADQVRLCIGFFRYFLQGDTDWPAETLRRFGQSAAAGDARLLSDWVDIKLFAARSRVVGDTVYFPFVALVLFVAARVEFFDAWTWPLALALLMGACFLLLVLAFALLRVTAYRARDAAIGRLERKVLELIGEPDKKELAAQVQHALEQVKSCSEGAFRPLSEEPVVRALIIPTGGLSGLGVLQYLYVQRF